MGGGISSLSFLSEHKELVARLKASFADNDGNKEIIANIARLRHVLSERPDICTTAKREIGLTFWPTNLASAKLEFDRLMRIYEDSMHRKSVVGRNQATCGCPLGHFCEKYRGKMGQCSLCSVKCTSGNSCSYCGYNLCDTCSIIYCHEGHTMILWTHPESQFQCVSCKSQPITSGYMCIICHDYNVCDMCTYIPGRRTIQNFIWEEIYAIKMFMEARHIESDTAAAMVLEYEKYRNDFHSKYGFDKYCNTMDLVVKMNYYRSLKPVVLAEVKLFHITDAVRTLRQTIGRDAHISIPAQREALHSARYTQDEIDRLQEFLRIRNVQKSVEVRCVTCVACPLGHAACKYEESPSTYRHHTRDPSAVELVDEERSLRRRSRSGDESCSMLPHVVQNEEKSVVSLGGESQILPKNRTEAEDCKNDAEKVTTISITWGQAPSTLLAVRDSSTAHGTVSTVDSNVMALSQPVSKSPWCKICDRLAPEGYHCAYCEYDMCMTCKVIYCPLGHPTTMWTATADGATQSCIVCGACELEGGYRCGECETDVCDACTSRGGRAKMRAPWEAEMSDILAYMARNSHRSDIARDFGWRETVFITSFGLLVTEVKQLRILLFKAKKQVKYKATIDKIKVLEKELIEHPKLSSTAARLVQQLDHVFHSKEEANWTLRHVQELQSAHIAARSQEHRQSCRCACPLGHGMITIAGKVPSTVQLITKFDRSTATFGSHSTLLPGTRGLREGRIGTDLRGMSSFGGSIGKVNAFKDLRDSGLFGSNTIPKNLQKYCLFKQFDELLDLSLIACPVDTTLPDDFSVEISDGHVVRTPYNSKNLYGQSLSPQRTAENLIALSPIQLNSPVNPGQPFRPMDLTASMIQPKNFSNSFYGGMSYGRSSLKLTSDGKTEVHLDAPVCRVCEDPARGGVHCALCEYSLCSTCSVVYCRNAHAMQIWTLHDVHGLTCNICHSTNITSGYRCVTCDLEICDMCTVKDTRESLVLWPKREIRKILDYFHVIRDKSEIAKAYKERVEKDTTRLTHRSMSHLCSELNELLYAKELARAEFELRSKKMIGTQYGAECKDA